MQKKKTNKQNNNNNNKTNVSKAESKYLSIPQDKDIQEHIKHWQTKKRFHFLKLVEMQLFCFLQEQQGKGINKIITIFFVVLLYWSVLN